MNESNIDTNQNRLHSKLPCFVGGRQLSRCLILCKTAKRQCTPRFRYSRDDFLLFAHNTVTVEIVFIRPRVECYFFCFWRSVRFRPFRFIFRRVTNNADPPAKQSQPRPVPRRLRPSLRRSLPTAAGPLTRIPLRVWIFLRPTDPDPTDRSPPVGSVENGNRPATAMSWVFNSTYLYAVATCYYYCGRPVCIPVWLMTINNFRNRARERLSRDRRSNIKIVVYRARNARRDLIEDHLNELRLANAKKKSWKFLLRRYTYLLTNLYVTNTNLYNFFR